MYRCMMYIFIDTYFLLLDIIDVFLILFRRGKLSKLVQDNYELRKWVFIDSPRNFQELGQNLKKDYFHKNCFSSLLVF